MRFCELSAAIENLDEGFIEVHAGSPDTLTETSPLNPPDPATLSVIGTLVLPLTRFTDVGENRDETEMEKSGEASTSSEAPHEQLEKNSENVNRNMQIAVELFDRTIATFPDSP